MNPDRAEVITLRQKIASVPLRWRETYNKPGSSPDKMQILRELEKLDTAVCTPDQINEIIGNDSWTQFECDGCGLQQDCMIRIGDEPDFETRWQDLCLACLNRAIELLTQGSTK